MCLTAFSAVGDACIRIPATRASLRGAHPGAGERHAAQTPTCRATPRPPRAAGLCPPHPAAGGQCCYERESVDCPHCELPHARPPLLCAPYRNANEPRVPAAICWSLLPAPHSDLPGAGAGAGVGDGTGQGPGCGVWGRAAQTLQPRP